MGVLICRRQHKNRKGFFMKKKLVLSAMLVALLALGLAVTGCPTEDDGGGSTNFSGEY
jgi:hypothetical protein